MHIDEFIARLPKAELSVHIEGTLDPEQLLKYAKRNKIKLPYANLDEAKAHYQFKDLQSFLTAYYQGVEVLKTEKDFYELTYTYLENAAAQTIRHAEISFDPQAHLPRGVKLETIVNGMSRAIADAKTKLTISAYLIMCFRRDLSVDEAEAVFQEALKFKDAIVAIGLDSTEHEHPPEKFEELFHKAREQGFLTTAIAGEDGPVDYIWQAVDVLRVTRIDHGVKAMQDMDLITRLSAIQLPITVCPVSNVKTGIVPNMRQHPLRRMYEEGLCVCINSDDPAYFGANCNDNYLAVNAALKMNKDMLFELAKNSFDASFLSYDEKQAYIDELEKFLLTAKGSDQQPEPAASD